MCGCVCMCVCVCVCVCVCLCVCVCQSTVCIMSLPPVSFAATKVPPENIHAEQTDRAGQPSSLSSNPMSSLTSPTTRCNCPLELYSQCVYACKYIGIHICMQIWHTYCKVLYVVREYTAVVGRL